MLIKRFQLLNYRAFLDSGPMFFESGINVIIGRNNVGKSSLLEALELPRLSVENTSKKSNPEGDSSISIITFEMTGQEVWSFVDKAILQNRQSASRIKAQSVVETVLSIKQHSQDEQTDTQLLGYLSADEVESGKELIKNKSRFYFSFSCHSRFSGSWISYTYNQSELSELNIEEFTKTPHQLGIDQEISKGKPEEDNILGQILRACGPTIKNNCMSTYNSLVYRFRSIRLINDRNHIGQESERRLKPDASNLANFLHYLQGDKPSTFQKLSECLNLIFPEIEQITVSQEKEHFEVRIWFYSDEEESCYFKLSECGSGVGQVIAILCVVIAMKEPSYVFIDEPQSFLHPGAAKSLIEILQLYPQHQYFITTHSPDIIKASDPASITLLKCKNLSTTAQSVDRNCLTGMRSILSEVGLKFSDFFGADQILWVEGPTEEKCFPIIIRKIGKSISKPVGLEILSVVSVGDFEKKRSELIFDVYNRLGAASSLFPPAAGFIFDREDRSESQREDLEKRMPNRVKFLPRRMYENYLLCPQAIAHVLNTEDTHKNRSYDVDTIKNWISENRHEYLNPNFNNKQEWKIEVDAAKLLKECFNELSENRVEFRKTRHSVQLTEWILDNNPNQLQELADFLSTTMQQLDILQ